MENTIQISRKFSMPRMMLHIEGAALLTAAVILYGHISGDWLFFALLFFAPDLTFIAFAFGTEWGARAYNLMHTLTLPLLLGCAALISGWHMGMVLALIWLAHIGMDRMVGYGLKYPTAFKDTHLNRL